MNIRSNFVHVAYSYLWLFEHKNGFTNHANRYAFDFRFRNTVIAVVNLWLLIWIKRTCRSGRWDNVFFSSRNVSGAWIYRKLNRESHPRMLTLDRKWSENILIPNEFSQCLAPATNSLAPIVGRLCLFRGSVNELDRNNHPLEYTAIPSQPCCLESCQTIKHTFCGFSTWRIFIAG